MNNSELVTKYNYDALYRVTSTVVDNGGLKLTTKYSYTPTGKISKQIDPNGHMTTFKHDVLDRKIEQIDAEMKEFIKNFTPILQYKYFPKPAGS